MIIDTILEEIEETVYGFRIQSFEISKDDDLTEVKDLGIYRGQAGFLLLLVREYQLNNNERILFLIKGVRSNLLIETEYCAKTLTNSFLIGLSGILFSILVSDKYCFSLNKQEQRRINKIMGSYLHFYSNNNQLGEYLDGHAGSIIGILKILSLNLKWIDYSILNKLLNISLMSLIFKTKINTEGVFWDYSKDNLFPLNGFSHGNSGIAYVLFLLSNYIDKQESLYVEIANRALNYENLTVCEGVLPDYRKYEMEISSLTNMSNKHFNAWCHGNLGGLIPREHSCYFGEANKDNLHFDTNSMGFSLCHGIYGNYIIADYLGIKYEEKSFQIDGRFKNRSLFTGTGSAIYYRQFKTGKIPQELNVFIPFSINGQDFKLDESLNRTLNIFSQIRLSSFQLNLDNVNPYGVSLSNYCILNGSWRNEFEYAILSEISKNRLELNLSSDYYIRKEELLKKSSIIKEPLKDFNCIKISTFNKKVKKNKYNYYFISTCLEKIIFYPISRNEFKKFKKLNVVPKGVNVFILRV